MYLLKTIFVLTLLVAPFHIKAQVPQWSKLTMYAGMAYDKVNAIHIDSKSNYYIAGDIQDYFGSTIKTNFTAGCVPMAAIRKDEVDGFVCRYDSLYNLTLNFVVPGRINDIKTDSAGNIILVGITADNYSFDGSTVIPNNANNDAFIAKYDNLGNLLWYRLIKSDDEDVISSLDIDKNGNLLICGFSNASSTFVFDHTIKFFNNFIVLSDPDGFIKWTSFRNFSNTRPLKIKFDNQANVVFTGSYGDASFNIRIAVGKLSGLNGSVIWKKIWGGAGTQYVQQGTSIAIAKDGDYIVGGEYSDHAVFDDTTLTSKGYLDIFLTRIDTAGNINWLKTAGSSEFDKIYDIEYSNNSIYFCGGYSNNFLIGDKVLHAIGYTDIFVGAMDTAGNVDWVVTAGSEIKGHKNEFKYHEYASAISLDSKNRLQVVGTTIGSGNFGKIRFLADESSNQNGYWATISFSGGSGIVRYPCNDDTANHIFQAYPNPFHNYLKFRIPELSTSINTKWSLFDAEGRLRMQGTFSGATFEIENLAVLAIGMYIVRINATFVLNIKMLKM